VLLFCCGLQTRTPRPRGLHARSPWAPATWPSWAGPAMQAHAITNVDPQRIAYLVACQDGRHDPKNPETDYNVWGEPGQVKAATNVKHKYCTVIVY